MNKAAIFHVSEYTYAYPVSPDSLRIRLIAAQGDLKGARVRYRNLYEHDRAMSTAVMSKILSDSEHDVFEARITVEEKRFKYYFELEGDEGLYYTSDGFLQNVTENNCFFYPYINDDEIFTLPKWAKGAIVYQILVDRFFCGANQNGFPDCSTTKDISDRDILYGGDFDGIIQKLNYISSLGTKIIYLSPIFVSPTYHKYDTIDYYTVESVYGGEEGLKKLVNAIHEHGMSVVLDGVFNHSSNQHPFFQDIILKGKKSKYSDWYNIYTYPEDGELTYNSFGGLVPEMPRWNTSNPAVAEYLTNAACHWTRQLSLDGWRLDVADEIPHSFWKYFRTRLKEVNPEILLIGEIWNHASGWLLGDELDTCTNYKYRNAVLSLANNIYGCKEFWKNISANLRLYKTPLWSYLVNVMGSHDTVRLHTQIEDERKAGLALLCTLCFEGMPLIYYGDEVGMNGGDDPDNRRAMRWEVFPALTAEVQAIGKLRNSFQALRCGTTIPLEQDSLLCFDRSIDENTIRVTANFGDYEKPIRLNGTVLFTRYTDSVRCDELSLLPGGLLLEKRDSPAAAVTDCK